MRNLSAELERETGGSQFRRDLDEAARTVRETAGAVKDDLRKLTDAASGRSDGERKP